MDGTHMKVRSCMVTVIIHSLGDMKFIDIIFREYYGTIK